MSNHSPEYRDGYLAGMEAAAKVLEELAAIGAETHNVARDPDAAATVRVLTQSASAIRIEQEKFAREVTR